jgi:hypothetical protein
VDSTQSRNCRKSSETYKFKPELLKAIRIKLPEIQVQIPEITVQVPEIVIPAIRLQTPLDIQIPEIQLPEIRIEIPKINVQVPKSPE